jgi:hypothetical protein
MLVKNMKKLVMWRCNFCKTYFSTGQALFNHQMKCNFNPNLKKCSSCNFYLFFNDDKRCKFKVKNHYKKHVIYGLKCDKWESKYE